MRIFVAVILCLGMTAVANAQQLYPPNTVLAGPTSGPPAFPKPRIIGGNDVTFQQSGTGSVSRKLQSKLSDIVSILDYGGDNTGVLDSGPACIAALNSFDLTRGGTLLFPRGDYTFTTPCTIPRFTNGTVRFEMTGAVISTNQAIHLFDRVPTDNTDASQIISAKFDFINGTLAGTNTAGQVGIFLGASYGSEIEGTTFSRLDIGLYTAFALKTFVHNCFGFQNTTTLIRFASGTGLWSGANDNNSQSNVSVINSCRDYASSGQLSSFEVLASDQIRINETISEGNHPVNNIHFDTQASTTVKSLLLRSVHSENGPTNAIIKLDGSGADIDVYNIIDQGGGVGGYLVVDSSTFSAGSISIESMPVLTNRALFSDGGGGQFWRFSDFGPGNSDPTNPVYWVGGVSPTNLIGIGRYPSGGFGSIFCTSCIIGSDFNVAASNRGIFMSGNVFWGADNTFGFGASASNPTGTITRPNFIAVGTGGIITDGDITPRTTGTVLVGNTTRTFAGVQLGAVGVDSLPSCTASLTGQVRYVNDANSTTYNATAASGGSNKLLVLCNGTAWTLH